MTAPLGAIHHAPFLFKMKSNSEVVKGAPLTLRLGFAP